MEQALENNETKEIKNVLVKDLSNEENQNIGEKQNKFMESTIGKVINTGIDLGLRALLPNAIENEVIGIKNVIVNDGFKEGIKAAISTATQIGKNIKGVFTNKFDSVSDAYMAVRSGGIIDTTSKMLDAAVNSAKSNKLISNTTAKVLKQGKNVVKDCLSSRIEESFMEQVDGVEKVGKYIQNWHNYLKQKDVEGMKREYNKINKKIDTLLPLESTLKEARIIENVQTLLKNKGNKFEDITEEELKLALTL